MTTIRTRDAIDGSYGADELRRASVIAPHPGERLFHHKEQNGALQLLARIQVAGDSIAASLDSRQTAEVVVRETCVLLDAEACLLFECPTGGAMRLIARRDSRTPRAISSADGIPGWVGTFPMSPVRADRQPKQARIAVDGEPRIVLALPAVHQEQVSGVIVVVGRSDRLFTVEQVWAAQTLANQAAAALYHARLYEDLAQRADMLAALYAVNTAMSTTLDLEEILTIITDQTLGLLKAEAASVAFYDEEDSQLWFAAASGSGSDYVRGKRLGSDQGIIGWVIEHGQPVLVSDVAQDQRFCAVFDEESGFTTRSIMCVPLQTGVRTVGAIEVMNAAREAFQEDDLRQLSVLASLAATAAQNAHLYQRAQKEIAERRRIEAALKAERASLEDRIAERTAELEQANMELSEAARLKDRFISTVSHELRTPLSVITLLSGSLDALDSTLTDAERRQMICDLRTHTYVLSDLVSDVLDVCCLSDWTEPVDFAAVDLACLAREEIAHQQPLAEAKSQEIRIVSDVGSFTPGSERHLRQILRNLLSNAIKYTLEGGKIICEVCTLELNRDRIADWPGAGDLSGDRWAVIRVSDTGIGIDEEHLPHIFDRFYRVETQGTTPGVGLGLSIAQELVELHKGRIAVTSQPGDGTTFCVYLPLWTEEYSDEGIRNNTCS